MPLSKLVMRETDSFDNSWSWLAVVRWLGSNNFSWLSDNFGNGWLGDDFLNNWLRDLDIGWFAMDDRVETIVVIGGVLDGTLVSIRVDQTVLTVHLIPMARFTLLLDVAGMVIVNTVGEIVLCIVIFIDVFYEGRLSNGFHDRGLCNCFDDSCWLGQVSRVGSWLIRCMNLLDGNHSGTCYSQNSEKGYKL